MGALRPFEKGVRKIASHGSVAAPKVTRLMGRLGPLAGRITLVLLGVAAALLALEGLLRLGAVLYQARPAVESDMSLAGADVYRVLCLGESTTAGLAWGDGAYPQQLGRILNERAGGHPRFNVINGGVVATTTDVIVARLPQVLDKYQPHIVVTMMGINDSGLSDPTFQVGGSLRVWKLLKMLYYSYRPESSSEQAEELLRRATATAAHWPDVGIELANQANRLIPDDPRPLLVIAEAQVTRGRVDEAREAYAKVVQMDSASVMAYAFDAGEPFVGALDWVLSMFHTDTHALAARAVLALRRKDRTRAADFAARSTEIDPRNAAALVLEGRLLQLAGSNKQALGKFNAAAAANPRLVGFLATDEVVGSPTLNLIAAREEELGHLEPAEPASPDEAWFARRQAKVRGQYKGLGLTRGWERIAKGESDKVAADLRALTAPGAESASEVQLRAYGQLAVLAWQRGDAVQAEQYHQIIEQALEDTPSVMTEENYKKLWKILHERGIPLVAVQYPMRRLASLRRQLGSATGVAFVDNERIFKDAISGRPYTDIFADLFGGEFGHMNVEGNRILADNVATTILQLVSEAGDA